MKAFTKFSLKPVLDEMIESLNRVNTVPVPVESEAGRRPVEIRRYIRHLRENRQTSIR